MNKIKKEQRLNEENLMECGMKAKIIKYNNSCNIDVQFEDGYIGYNKTYYSFKNGTIFNRNLKISTFIDKTNEKNINYQNLEMVIVRYGGAFDMDIKFTKSGYIHKNRNYDDFQKGKIKDNLYPEVCGIGFFGEGSHNGKEKSYSTWTKMITRCYKKEQEKYRSYIDCSVCKEWLNFQNFAEWYDENYYSLDNERMHLDKDILIKGNKVYSPDTSCFVDSRINCLFTKTNIKRGDLPIGVKRNYNSKINPYNASMSKMINNQKTKIWLGSYNTPEKAFNAYKESKEAYIKQVANDYSQKYPNFPTKLYNAMYNYKVEITD